MHLLFVRISELAYDRKYCRTYVKSICYRKQNLKLSHNGILTQRSRHTDSSRNIMSMCVCSAHSALRLQLVQHVIFCIFRSLRFCYFKTFARRNHSMSHEMHSMSCAAIKNSRELQYFHGKQVRCIH